jgi:branched-subunit amino acid ABC-type transport system permease component
VFIMQLLDVVTTAGVLYIVALGLFIVYGVLKIINLAHGAFLAMGAYAGVITTRRRLEPVDGAPTRLRHRYRDRGGGRVVLSGLYARPLDTILATWGLNIIVVQAITLYFGREIHFAASAIERAVDVGGVTYSAYRLVLLLIAVVLGVAVRLVLQRTQIGTVARAVIS